jgi:hypothetical protein
MSYACIVLIGGPASRCCAQVGALGMTDLDTRSTLQEGQFERQYSRIERDKNRWFFVTQKGRKEGIVSSLLGPNITPFYD